MTTRFKNAIDALVYAFFNDTLAKGTCSCCAIGNIVAWADGKKVIERGSFLDLSYGCDQGDWISFFATMYGRQRRTFKEGNVNIRKSLESTGYSIVELANVEKAFELATKIEMHVYPDHTKEAIMQDQYNGLCAVVEVLCEIEGIANPAEYKELFTIH